MNEKMNEQGEEKYLAVDFSINLEIGSINRDDIYRESLKEQFKKIQRKLKFYGKEEIEFEEFVRLCFPKIKATYYVSAPSFRVVTTEYNGYKAISNMYIRPEKTIALSSIIPKELDIFFVGDFLTNGSTSFVVKGIELIDNSISKPIETKISCNAVYVLKRSIDRKEYPSFLDNNTIINLTEKTCPVYELDDVISILDDWGDYIEFRGYYLEEQSKKNEKINKVEVKKAYSISRSEYKKNLKDYSELLLDGIKSFEKRDEVILSEKVENSTEISLIKVEISRNLSEINQNSVEEGKMSLYERELRKFSRDSVALSPIEPRNMKKNEKNKNLYIGDRLAFEVEDIYPDCSKIINKFNEKIKQEETSINDRYRKIIENKVSEAKKEKNKELERLEKEEKEEYFKQLDNTLETDILENKDQDIKKEIQKQIKEIKDKYNNLRKKIKKSNKKQKDKNIENKEEIEKIAQNEKEEISKIDISSFYIERNEKLKEEYIKDKKIERDKKLKNFCIAKEKEIRQELEPSIAQEKQSRKDELEEEKKKEVEVTKEELSQRYFYIYFKIDDKKINDEELKNLNFLIYDNRAEKKKIERQEKALYSLYDGYVKNPFLASYFFEAEKLPENENEIQEIEYFSERLNDRQKEAVKRAVRSKGLFLLQGPPGTGKTEVIAEIAAQYIKQGRKVLISSETHKAIDNVFERLPKIPEIRALRLLPSSTLTKETNYSPKKLVDNLYFNISSVLNRKIKQYNNFKTMKNDFNDKMQDLKFRHKRLLELKESCKDIENKKKKFQQEISECDIEIQTKRSSKKRYKDKKSGYEVLLSQIENGNFNDEINNKRKILVSLNSDNYLYINYLNLEKIKKIHELDIEQVEEEFKLIEENEQKFSIESQKQELKSKIEKLVDPDTYLPLSGKEKEVKKLQEDLIRLKNNEPEDNIDYSKYNIVSLVPANEISTNKNGIIKELMEIKLKINNFISEEREEIAPKIEELDAKIENMIKEIADTKKKKDELSSKKEELENDNSYTDFKEKGQVLKREIKRFFEEFEIYEEYEENNFDDAIEIIEKKWKDIEINQGSLEEENKLKIPMYESICKYLADEKILEEDRISFTKKLFINANIFGITCTSRDNFTEDAMEELREYNLGDVNIRNVGIDVVIIDEVSKSSFLELLISTLYGKTVILVGDHRQLPPLYDLKHLKENDFENLDPTIINYQRNKEYQELYEKSFFKELFEKIPDSYKIMLNKQYRCHSDIMDVFNHFYKTDGKKGLEIGLTNQNDIKQHGLLIKEKNKILIDPENHVYFVNCNEYESRNEDSSSIINEQEAEVVSKLLKLINEEYGNMLKKGDLVCEKNRDERKSIGVICTYSDQAKQIKNKIKGEKFENFSKKREERLIINTVDDFQGDERDIIILSMVRNPKGRHNREFIDQFERINVALSRARCMLIIVGAQDFLSKTSIDLPDINGHKELDIKIYKEIIKTIQMKGRILQAEDIIGEEKNDK
ncbi:AAA domain-containing protein [Fusobacterium pseudoperiodonticum]|uniref:AAA domain-containing protein n=1 Tax=Fusobacterium pseudoperiodonticum TaxID=2663009 RepID=UPI0028E95739|nr:AAA domain-containing protein [Fusobacterium pseudoperiodonticum]